MRPRTTGPVIALLLAAVVVGGCTSSTKKLVFPPDELQRLDGLRHGQEVELETTDGTIVEFTTGMTLRFDEPGAPTRKLRCEQIDLDGSLLACVNAVGIEERVDVSRGKTFILIRTSKTSWGRVALGVLGVYVVLAIFAAAAG